MKFSEYLKGAAAEYAPHVKEAASGLVLRKLAKADEALRNPETLGNILDDILDGIADAWRACPHGIAPERPCAKCAKETPEP